MKVRNPRNGLFDYTINSNTLLEIEEMASHLKAQQKSWSNSGIAHRVEVLLKWLSILESDKEDILQALSVDTGRRKISAIEFDGAIGVIRGRCLSSPHLLNAGEERSSVTNPTVKIRQQWVPYPLVGVISPWNFPLLLALIDTVPALLAGSTVLLKPSELTPRFIDPLEKSILKIPLLANVLKLVRGGVETGKAVVNQVDVICFTGSVPTGKLIAQRCAERFVPAFLELGGKDPAIVLEDADIEITTDAIMRSAVGATGQACQALERIYIDEKIHDSFIEVLLKKCKACLLNNDYHKGGTLGPLIFDKQAELIASHISDAKDKGAKILHGGEIENLNGGLWLKATLLIDVNHSMKVMTEESFGPLIPVMKYAKIEQAIAWANDSAYGLSASVFSKDIHKALEVANQIDAGGISINDASLTNKVFDATKNSFKNSGLNGSRMGVDGFTRFFRKKALMVQHSAPSSIHSQDEES